MTFEKFSCSTASGNGSDVKAGFRQSGSILMKDNESGSDQSFVIS